MDATLDHPTVNDLDPAHDEANVLEDRAQRGASLVEYALLVALIALVCIAAVTLLGAATATQFSSITDGLS